MIAFFTGHRNLSETHRNGVEQLIAIALEREAKTFLSGMALGTDMMAAEVLSQQKLAWWAIIPCADQSKFWSTRQRDRYDRLLGKAEKQIVLADSYHAGVMMRRNLWMVRHSQLCLAVYDENPVGGTAQTVRMAIAKGLTVVEYNPLSKQIKITPRLQYQQLSLF